MNTNNKVFCPECREHSHWELKKEVRAYEIKGKTYNFEMPFAYCKNCGEEIEVHGLMDLRAGELDRQYREAEDIVSIKDIENLMELYNIGKAPLSLALGFGEITITRYLKGQIPSKEYSDVIKKALESPGYMLVLLNENIEKIGLPAYKKAESSIKELQSLLNLSEKMLSVISYIFEKAREVTPLALQKMLYFIEGFFMAFYNTTLYKEDCVAWLHGPVYEAVYDIFKTFKFSPIDDLRFVILKNRFNDLSQREKEVIDLIVDSFGMYSGKALEVITHKEEPWINARKGFSPTEPSRVCIPKKDIEKYFKDVYAKYDIKSLDGVKQYIACQLGG